MPRGMPNRARLQEFSLATLGINARNRGLVRRLNPRKNYPLANDKLETKRLMEEAGVPVPKTFEVFSSMLQARGASERLAGRESFVVKPSQGAAGSGILVLVGRENGAWLDAGGQACRADRLNRHVANIIFGNFAHGLSDRALVEERLIQGELLAGDRFPGLPDLRVIALEGRQIMAMLRLPTKRSGGRANLHQGAIGVGVDIDSGRTLEAIDRGRSIRKHPDSGARLVGRTLEGWKELREVARMAAAAVPLGYLGLDLCVDASRGPLVLEVNARPGLEIQNANGRGLRGRLRGLGFEVA